MNEPNPTLEAAMSEQLNPLYLGGTMDGPLCDECGHILPPDGRCLIGHSRLWVLCEHGKIEPHRFVSQLSTGLISITYETCPGGHPVEAVKVWWCETHKLGDGDQGLFGPGKFVIRCYGGSIALDGTCRMVERFLIPLSNPEGEK